MDPSPRQSEEKRRANSDEAEGGPDDVVVNDRSNHPLLDALHQLSAEMASVKPDMNHIKSELEKNMHKRRGSFSERLESEASLSEGEDMHKMSEDSNQAKKTASSIDTRIKTLIASNDKTPAKSDTAGGGVLGEIALDLKVKEQTGKAVNDELAAIVESLLSEKLPDAKLQAKLDLYPRPDNVKGLKTPRVNQLIWQQLAAAIKTYDAKQQKT